MPMYANIGGSSKQLTSIYFNKDGSSKSLTNVYANINGSSKEIFPPINYRWDKYVSFLYKTNSEVTGYDNPSSQFTITSTESIPASSFFTTSGTKHTLKAYSSYTYSTSTGLFTLSGGSSFVYRTDYVPHWWEPEDSESTLIGMYMPKTSGTNTANGTTTIYKITGFHDPDAADSDYYFKKSYLDRGSAIYSYTYEYHYQYNSTVTSYNPNAYTSGSTESYISSSDNDIRTVYVKVT